MALVFLAAPLGYRLADQLAEGQKRPLAYPVSAPVAKALVERPRREPDIDLVLAGRAPVGWEARDVGTGIVLASKKPVSTSPAAETFWKDLP